MSPHRPSRSKAQQSEETIAALVESARALFADRGYVGVSLADVVAAAGVTKGALYHHFTGKDDLFAAVLGRVHESVADRVAGAADENADAWTQLVEGCRAFLVASTDPGIQQIMLIDAPSVVGWDAWRDFDAEGSMRHLRDVLTRLVDDGTLVAVPVDALTHLLSGAMNEAAMWRARSDRPDHDLDATMAVLTTMLDALRSSR
jgi:AcrR family transcriptional regulator